MEERPFHFWSSPPVFFFYFVIVLYPLSQGHKTLHRLQSKSRNIGILGNSVYSQYMSESYKNKQRQVVPQSKYGYFEQLV